MEQVALYRKYRPHNFDNLVGQDHVKTTLINALTNGNTAHAYIFSGPRGTGKTSTARLLAKALCCSDLQDGYEPCDKCEFCTDVKEGRLIDLIEIDAASNRGIDEVRDLKEKIGFAPSRAKVKIYIIDEVHMMTKEAFNALLKTLEEPPEHAYFILATTEIHKVPETIISRCQRFDFKRIDKKALMTRLSYICQKEEIKADDMALELISRYSDGGLRDAIGLVEQLTVNKELKYDAVHDILGVSDLSLLENLFDSLMKRDPSASLKIISELHSQGSDLKQFVHEFIDMIREKMLSAVAKDEKAAIPRFIQIIEELQETQRNWESSIPQLPLEIAVIKLTSDIKKPVLDEVTEEIVVEEITVEETPKRGEEPKKVEEKELDKEKTIEEVESEPEDTDLPPLTIAHLKDKWPRITERVKRPPLRMSLKNAVPVMVDGVNITLEFNTKFHKDKVIEHDNRVELETVIKELFGQGVKISALVKELEIKSVVADDGAANDDSTAGVAAITENVELSAEEEDDLADQALEIFGGELVED